jgi:flavorubredoxin
MSANTLVNEIATDVYRISLFVPEFNLQFNHFLVKDEEPLLYHTGMRRMFPEIREAVARLINPADLRWISFSHFEVDECGALNEWLQIAPSAQAACGVVMSLVNLADYAIRPARALDKNEVLQTGKYKFRFCPTPHLPHGWDAGVMFEETNKTLFCSDLFHQSGAVEPVTESDILGRVHQSISEYQKGPLMDYMPYTSLTERLLNGLAELQPCALAIMHGSSFVGDGARALRDLNVVMRETFGRAERD